MTTATYPDNWQARIEFYGAKWEGYKKRHPAHWPTKRTIRRWTQERNETTQNSKRLCNEMTDEL